MTTRTSRGHAGTDGFLDHVRSVLPVLTASELRVARCLLNREPTAGLGSSASLAAEAGVSGPTVTRFVKKLGFSDHAAFQRALRSDIDARMVSPVDTVRGGLPPEGEHPPRGLAAYGDRMAALVRATTELVSAHEFEESCALLADVKHPVLTAGGWNTVVAARHLAAQLQQVRPAVAPVAESFNDVSASIADRGPRPTAVLFDLRRYEERTIALARALHDQAARVVLLTDHWMSPAARPADFVLPVAVEGGQAFDSLLGALAITEALVDRTAQLLGDAALTRIQNYNSFSMMVAPRWEPDDPDQASDQQEPRR